MALIDLTGIDAIVADLSVKLEAKSAPNTQKDGVMSKSVLAFGTIEWL